MQIDKGDYIFYIDLEDRKSKLCKVTSLDNVTIKGFTPDIDMFNKSTVNRVTTSRSYVEVNLGPEPIYFDGKPFDIYRFQTEVKGWGAISWLTPADDDMIDMVHDRIKEAKLEMKDFKLHPFDFETRISIGSKNTKILGMYKHAPKGVDQLTLILDRGLSVKTITHEYGHGLWHRVMSDRKRAEWVEAYHASVVDDTLGDNVRRSILYDMRQVKSRAALASVVKDARKEGNDVSHFVKEVFKWSFANHCLSRKELNVILDSGATIAKYLPETIDYCDKSVNTGVTDYANKNTSEFWCESFSEYLAGAELPETVEKLMEATLTSLKGSR